MTMARTNRISTIKRELLELDFSLSKTTNINTKFIMKPVMKIIYEIIFIKIIDSSP